MAFNIVQYGRWSRLPVGVMTVMANTAHGALYHLASDRDERGPFEVAASRALGALLPDPEDK